MATDESEKAERVKRCQEVSDAVIELGRRLVPHEGLALTVIVHELGGHGARSLSTVIDEVDELIALRDVLANTVELMDETMLESVEPAPSESH